MRKPLVRLLPLLVAVLLAVPVGAAAAADWSVAQMSGKVSISVGVAQPVALRNGEVLPAGGVLTTGPASRALLVRDAETMVVGANAAVAIPSGPTNRQYTTILENAGIVEFSVEKQNVQHFAVETPYLAAVVKGTQFSVDVGRGQATVKVTRGIVEVTALATGYVITLQVGESAIVRADGTMLFAGPGATPPVYQGQPRPPVVGLTFDTGGGGLLGLGGGTTTASLNAGPLSLGASLGSGGLSLGAYAGGSVGFGANVGDGGASVSASVGDAVNLNAGIGGGGAALSASVGNAVNAAADLGGDGASVNASVAGISAGATVGSNGVEVDAGGANVAVGGGGVQVDAGPVGADVGGGGIDIDLGPIHLGLGR